MGSKEKEKDKLRVYMTFYPRRSQAGTFHTAMLITPKNPAATEESWRFDIHQLPVRIGPGGATAIRWTYGWNRGQTGVAIADRPGQLVDARSKNLLTALLVGKLNASVSIEELKVFARDAVDISAHDPNNHNWVCHDWVVEVISAMDEANMFSKKLSSDPTTRAMWENGLTFAMKKAPSGYDYTSPLPVCDASGKPRKSEIPKAPNLVEE